MGSRIAATAIRRPAAKKPAHGHTLSSRGERVGYNATSAMLTEWKKTDELAFLNEVSSVPLQQVLQHLQTAFANFFAKRAGYPRFKAKKKCRT